MRKNVKFSHLLRISAGQVYVDTIGFIFIYFVFTYVRSTNTVHVHFVYLKLAMIVI